MTIIISNTTQFQDSAGNVKNLATELGKVGTGGSGGATALSGLTDVNIPSTPSEGQVLKYTAGKWAPGTDNAGAAGPTSHLIATYTHTANIVIQPTALDLTTGIFTCANHGLAIGDKISVAFNDWGSGTIPINKVPYELFVKTTYVATGGNCEVLTVPDANTFTLKNVTSASTLVFNGNGTVNSNVDVTAFHFEKLQQGHLTNLGGLTDGLLRIKSISTEALGSIYLNTTVELRSNLLGAATSFSLLEYKFTQIFGTWQGSLFGSGTNIVRQSPTTSNYITSQAMSNAGTANQSNVFSSTFGDNTKHSPINSIDINMGNAAFLNGTVLMVYSLDY